jgi:hypothetical protein
MIRRNAMQVESSAPLRAVLLGLIRVAGAVLVLGVFYPFVVGALAHAANVQHLGP